MPTRGLNVHGAVAPGDDFRMPEVGRRGARSPGVFSPLAPAHRRIAAPAAAGRDAAEEQRRAAHDPAAPSRRLRSVAATAGVRMGMCAGRRAPRPGTSASSHFTGMAARSLRARGAGAPAITAGWPTSAGSGCHNALHARRPQSVAATAGVRMGMLAARRRAASMVCTVLADESRTIAP